MLNHEAWGRVSWFNRHSRILAWYDWYQKTLTSILYLSTQIILQWHYKAGLQIRVGTGKLFFLFLNQYISCKYSQEPSQRDGSFEHPKHMIKMMGKEINSNLGAQTILIWTYDKGTVLYLHPLSVCWKTMVIIAAADSLAYVASIQPSKPSNIKYRPCLKARMLTFNCIC